MRKLLTKFDLGYAQAAILVAIGLQLTLNDQLLVAPKYFIACMEILLIFGIGITAPLSHNLAARIRRDFSLVLIALITTVNAASMLLIADSLINGSLISGHEVIFSAATIYLTNIIIFSIWFWEIDSPGLTGIHRHDAQPQFFFPQMVLGTEAARKWEPTYLDYLYLSVTNSTAFSPTDTAPLTHGTKALMGLQAFISLITVVLVTARAVTTLA